MLSNIVTRFTVQEHGKGYVITALMNLPLISARYQGFFFENTTTKQDLLAGESFFIKSNVPPVVACIDRPPTQCEDGWFSYDEEVN